MQLRLSLASCIVQYFITAQLGYLHFQDNLSKMLLDKAQIDNYVPLRLFTNTSAMLDITP